jgi:HEAT repeat protein
MVVVPPPAEIPKPAPKPEKSKLEMLIEQLGSKEPAEQIKAAETLRQMGSDAKEAAEALCRLAITPLPDVRQAALEALERILPDLYSHVVSLIVNIYESRGAIALAKMKEVGRPAAPVLVWRIKELRAQYGDYPRKQPTMGTEAIFNSLNPTLKALGSVGTSDPEAVKAISDLINSNEYLLFATRYSCAEALGQIGIDTPGLRKQVRDVLVIIASGKRDSNARMDGREKALDSIGDLGPDAKETVPLLRKLKLADEENIRRAATRALEKIEGK